jgi:GDP-4-dehydro-6-deoxy-D-mannose reductase
MATALITGVAGFCAAHLARRLAAEGHAVVGVDRTGAAPQGLRLARYRSLDVCNAADVADAVRDFAPDWVFHLAGIPSGPAIDVYRINFLASIYLLEAIREHAPKARVLLVGSAAEYGQVAATNLPITEDQPCRPVGPYGVAKHAQTLAALDLVHRLGLKIVIARPFNIIGAGISPSLVVGAILDRAKRARTAPSPWSRSAI